MLSNIGCFACAIIFVTGCNCEQKAQDMEDRANRFFAQRMKCCDELRDLGQIEAAAECYRQLADDIEQTGSDLLDWQIACENDDREAMDLILRILLARESSGIACDTPSILTKGDLVANVASPLSEEDSVFLELEPVGSKNGDVVVLGASQGDTALDSSVRSAVQQLAGTFMIQNELGMASGGEARGTIAWQIAPSPFGEDDVRHYVPTQFKLRVVTPLGNATFSLKDHEHNQIDIDSSGEGTFKAALDMKVPVELGIVQQVVWVEIPVSMAGNRISFTAVGISGLEFAPQVPHGWADWNSDWTVDMSDYAAFLADFAIGNADLNYDQVCNDIDIELFEEAFFNEFSG